MLLTTIGFWLRTDGVGSRLENKERGNQVRRGPLGWLWRATLFVAVARHCRRVLRRYAALARASDVSVAASRAHVLQRERTCAASAIPSAHALVARPRQRSWRRSRGALGVLEIRWSCAHLQTGRRNTASSQRLLCGARGLI